MALSWVKDYLSNRHQSDIVNTARSSSRLINAGVPQGSVLGPLLLLVYVNDISENLLSISRLFADDTSLVCSATTIAGVEGILNHDLPMISVWARQWLVTFNPDKTVAMHFSKTINDHPRLIFNDVQLQFVKNHKHLGFTLSSNGKWREHITKISVSASKILGMIRSLKFKLQRRSLNQIYISFLRPALEYASVVWDNCTVREKEYLEKIQNEAARIVTGVTRSISLENLYREIGWLTLSDRRKYQKLVLTYKIFNGQTPNYLLDIFPPNVNARTQYTLRNANDIDLIAHRTELFASSFIPSAIKLWNELPVDIKSIQSLPSFKSYVILSFSVSNVPKYYLEGDRKLSSLHTRIRNNCSDFKFDLFSNGISVHATCGCGYPIEDAEHYLFRCNYYTVQRHYAGGGGGGGQYQAKY